MGNKAKWDSPVILTIQKEIRRSKESRYDHRLHALLLVAQGMRCPLAARYLGDAPRTVQYWIRLFASQGLKGMEEGARSGRRSSLSLQYSEIIAEALRKSPEEFGISFTRWNGKVLSEFLQNNCQVTMSIRQCQRIIQQFENRSRKKHGSI